MKLDEREQRIIATLPLRPDVSLEALAKELKVRVHQLRYAISSLIEAGVLEPVSLIDIGKLGWSRYTLFFSLDLRSLRDREKILQSIAKNPRVAFLARCEGQYEFELSLAARSSTDAQRALDEILLKSGARLSSKILVPRIQIHNYQRKYLSPRSPLVEFTLYSPLSSETVSVVSPAVDEKDLGLLSALAENPSVSLRDLASVRSLSLATVHARVQRLREEKIYMGRAYLVHFAEYGARFYSLFVSLASRSASEQNILREVAKSSPYCVHCVENMGEWDFEFGIEVPSAEHLPEAKLGILEPLKQNTVSTLVVPRVSVEKFVPFPIH